MRARRSIPLLVVALAGAAAACVPPAPPQPDNPAATTAAATPAPTSATTTATTSGGTAPTTAATTVPTTVATTTTTTTTLPPPVGGRHGATPATGYWHVEAASATKVVYASVVHNGILYLGGTFDRLVSEDGKASLAQSNFAAIRMSTGEPVAMPGVDGVVESLVVANGRLYVGGKFDNIGGQGRKNLGAIELSSHAVSSASVTPSVGGKVWALAASGTHLYVGGEFTTIGGKAIARLARVRLSDAVVESGFDAGIAGGRVRGVAVAGDKVYAGGQFTSTGGRSDRPYLASVDAVTGQWSGPETFQFNFGANISSAGFQDVVVSPDGTRVFAGAQGKWNAAVAWNTVGTKAGRLIWQCRTKGNIQAVAISNGDLYFGFHDGYEVYEGPPAGGVGTIEVVDGRIKVLRVGVYSNGACPVEKSTVPYTDPVHGTVQAAYPTWAPKIDNQVWSITTDGDRLVVTGDFTKVWETEPVITKQALTHQGFVIFD